MADKYKTLFLKWCDALLGEQITDETDRFFGSFRCESCATPHGRADNAIYPFVYAYSLTGKIAYLSAVEKLLVFREKLTDSEGAVQNDFTSEWKGITSFSAIGLLKTLLYFGDKLPPDLKAKIETAAAASARWVSEKMTIGFPAYVNYYCAASLVNTLYYEYTREEIYAERSRELMRYCLGCFTENGLLFGEGKPHDARSLKGCLPIDIGYVAEESLPCLIHAAAILQDEAALSILTDHARKTLDFFLPDGGLDNSFGVRNNKWTYYGSRTSDGAIGALAFLSKRDERFGDAAERVFLLLERCTKNGKLYGGPHYFASGQKPCVHHTFCHACALADALREGISERNSASLPENEDRVGFRYYPELDTYLIRAGRYRATVTAYDFVGHTFARGAAHASGGTLSLLYKDGKGALIAGSTYEYERTEPNNMQTPAGEKKHASLLVRVEYEKDGIRYATCLDRNAKLSVISEENAIIVSARARFYDVNGQAENPRLFADFTYRFTPNGVAITASKLDKNVRFILPVVENSSEVLTGNAFEQTPIFYLSGGFSANEYAFPLSETVTVTIR